MDHKDTQPSTMSEASSSENQEPKASATAGFIDHDDGSLIPEIDESYQAKRKPARKGIYLLPNLITTAALFCGFYAIVSGMNGLFEQAAIAIFIAMILDGLDGRVARMTNTQSDFGAEYDSLSDAISFGAAPALVSFSFALTSLGKLGWAAAFIYLTGAALRLARFNTLIEVQDKRWFLGLPSPSAAALVAGFIWFAVDSELSKAFVSYVLAGILVFAGIMMISNVKFYSFKELHMKGKVPFFVFLLAILAFLAITTQPATLLFFIFAGYTVYGFFYWLIKLRKPEL